MLERSHAKENNDGEQNAIQTIQAGKASSRKTLFSENFARSNSQNTESISDIDMFLKEQVTPASEGDADVLSNFCNIEDIDGKSSASVHLLRAQLCD